MNKHIVVSIALFIIVIFMVIFAFFMPEWIISDAGGQVQIGLWQTCIITRKVPKCFISSAPTEWLLAIGFIIVGCFFATLTVVVLIGALKTHYLFAIGRWLGLATLAFFSIAAVLIPMGFYMEPIRGEPFQLPSSFSVCLLLLIIVSNDNI